MDPMSKQAVQAAFVNVSRSERGAVGLPGGFAATDWPSLDFLGWRDPRFPLRGYLVRQHGREVVAVAMSTTGGGLPTGRKAMCSICRAVDSSSAIALFTARRAGSAGRRGDSVGTYICAGLDCSEQLRHPTARPGRARLDTGPDVEAAAAAMLGRLDHFLHTVTSP